ncbi:YhfC family intramembrane metalloprotease [Thermococcus chitonophagus]|uniref:YhfC family intramembrane metalloprotease n=1 Tax=Thermococcus chitonophagus TaxID=54262 RepID=UPI0012ECCD48|nr:YhfC family intramembrane metalloprotease [Thermococcus chitonophagus]
MAWFTLYLLGLRKFKGAEFILGVFVFFFAMLLQGLIQQGAFLLAGIRSNRDIIERGLILVASLWVGLSAGFIQEGVKFALVRDKSKRQGAFVGLGFGITEVLAVVVSFAIISFKGLTLDVPFIMGMLTLAERYLAVLFHVATTILLAGASLRTFLTLAGIHAVVDSLAAYYQLARLVDPAKSVKVLILSEAVLGLVVLVLLVYALPQALKEEEKEEVIW